METVIGLNCSTDVSILQDVLAQAMELSAR